MAEFRFYCVSRARTSRVLRVMLEKTLERGDRAVVRVSSLRREEELDIFLWMEPAAGFLPHSRVRGRSGGRQSGEDFTAEHPVLLTTAAAIGTQETETQKTETQETGTQETKDEVGNGARVLFHWQEGGEGGMDLVGDGKKFGLCCFLYEEGDGDAGGVAEDLWGKLQGMGGMEAGFWYAEGSSWRRRGVEEEKVVAEKEEGQEREEGREQVEKREEVQEEKREEVREEEREEIVEQEEVGIVSEPSQESLF